MTTPSDEHERPARLEALLSEGAWLRRLAGSLLSDPAEADDLSQDVLAAALARPPELEGARLRGWLRTVARRIATRGRERGTARAAAEQRAARPEQVERDALAHVELHRRLVAAILALEPPYRTAILLRYLQDLPPRAIAARLGITETAARKRVSRGLEQLRAALDGAEGRAAWSAAAASLVRPSGARPPARSLPPAALPPLLALMSQKTTLFLLSSVAAAALFLGLRSLLAAPEHAALNAAAAPVAALAEPAAPSAAAQGQTSGIEPTPGAAGRVAVAGAQATAAAPRLRVVAQDGAPLGSARAAWVDAGVRVHALALDGAGSAELPPGAEAGRFFAMAPGFVEGQAHGAGADAVDVVLTLEPAVELHGRLVEDGGPPGRALRLVRYGSNLDLDFSDWKVTTALEQAGALRGPEEAWTAPDGSFVFRGLRRGACATIGLPLSHVLLPSALNAGHDRRQASAAADGTEAVLEVTRLPGVTGTLVWEDDGAPVHAALTVIFSERGGGGTYMTYAHSDPDGRFEIGVPVAETDLLLPPSERRRILYSGLRLGVEADGGRTPLGFEHAVALEGDLLPLDLGVLRVPWAREIAVRIVGPDGAAVAGAAVASSVAGATSDAAGLAHLAVGPADALRVLATGLALGEFAVEAEGDERAKGADEPRELRLAPGSSLAVHVDAASVGLMVRLSWDATPFEGASADDPLPAGLHTRLHANSLLPRGYRPDTPGTPGFMSFPTPAAGELIVSGLRAGSAFTAALVDAVDQPLVERAVEMPLGPGAHALDLGLADADWGRLRVRLLDEAGNIVPAGNVTLRRRDGEQAGLFRAPEGLLDLGPLAAGTYGVSGRAEGFMECAPVSWTLGPEASVLELTLKRARNLKVSVRDEDGRPVAARALALRDEDGWSAGDYRDPDLEPSLGSSSFVAPLCQLSVEARIGLRSYSASVDATATESIVTVPRHALLRVVLEDPPPLQGKNGTLALHLHEVNGEGALELSLWYQRDATGPLELETPLLPGAYELELELVERSPNSLESDPPSIRLLARRRLEVAGDTTLPISDSD